MEIVWYWVFSLLECLLVFHLMFSVFSFRFREYIPEVIFSSVVLVFICYSLRMDYNLAVIVPVAKAVMLVILLRLVFKVHFFYAMMMSMALAFFKLFQMAVFIVANIFGIFGELMSTLEGYSVQVVTMLMILGLCMVIKKYGWRYTFIPFGLCCREKYSHSNLLLMLTIVLEVLFVGIAHYVYMMGWTRMFWALTLFSISLFFLFFELLYKKEMGH